MFSNFFLGLSLARRVRHRSFTRQHASAPTATSTSFTRAEPRGQPTKNSAYFAPSFRDPSRKAAADFCPSDHDLSRPHSLSDTRLMFTFTPLLGAQSDSNAVQSLLEFDYGVKILVDVGWDNSFDADRLRQLET